MIGHHLTSWMCVALLTALCSVPAASNQIPGKPSAAPTSPPRQLVGTIQNTTIPDPITVDDAVRIGLVRNPQTTAAVAGVASALANYRSIAAFPSLELGITHAQGTSTAPTLNGANTDTFFDIGEVLDTSGQRRFQAAGARAMHGAARYQYDELKLTLAQQIRDAYWSLAAATALTRFSLESLDEAVRVNKLIHTQHDAGAAPEVDVIRSSIDVANARQAYVTAQGAQRSALSALNVLLARPPSAPVKLAVDITDGIDTNQSAPNLPDIAVLTKSAVAKRPVVSAAAEQVRVAEYAVKQARAGRFPDLSVDFERSLQQTSDTVLLSVKFPLVDFGNIRHSVKSAEETRKQAVAQKDQVEQQVAQQVAQAVLDSVQAQTLLTSYLNEILNPSVKLRDMAQLGYRQGATGILPLIDAETTLRNARSGYINSLLAVRKAQDELLAALAGSVPK